MASEALSACLQDLQQYSRDNAVELLDDLQAQIAAVRGSLTAEEGQSQSKPSPTAASKVGDAPPALPAAEGGGSGGGGGGGQVDDEDDDADATFSDLELDPAWRPPPRAPSTSDEEEEDDDDDDEDEEDAEENRKWEIGYSVIPMTQSEFVDLCALVDDEEEAAAAADVDDEEEGELAVDTADAEAAAESVASDAAATVGAASLQQAGVAEQAGTEAVEPQETEVAEAAVAAEAEAEAAEATPVYDRFSLPVIFKAGTTGFEDSKDYRPRVGDVVAGRYLVRAALGEAAFSVALRCVDLHAPQEEDDGTGGGGSGSRDVCLKVVKNNKDYFDQSLDEIKLLSVLRESSTSAGSGAGGAAATARHRQHVLQLFDYFYFREHLILSTELLGPNLYEFSKRRRKAGLPNVFADVRKLRFAARQILEGLAYIHGFGIIHCDIKPENILLTDPGGGSLQLKIIDYGSSAYATDKLTLYIQSRSYRAPEVILGIPYDFKIDVWSAACVVAELYTGRVLLHSDSVQGLLAKAIGTLGDVPDRVLKAGSKTADFFCSKSYVYKAGAGDSDDEDGEGDDSGDDDDNDDDDHNDSDEDEEDHGDQDDDEENDSDGSGGERRRRRRRRRRRTCVRVFQPLSYNALEQQVQTTNATLHEFLRSLLDWDPEQRPSAEEALALPFLALPTDQHDHQVFVSREELMELEEAEEEEVEEEEEGLVVDDDDEGEGQEEEVLDSAEGEDDYEDVEYAQNGEEDSGGGAYDDEADGADFRGQQRDGEGDGEESEELVGGDE